MDKALRYIVESTVRDTVTLAVHANREQRRTVVARLMMIMDGWLDVPLASAYVGVAPSRIQAAIARGCLKAVKAGRYGHWRIRREHVAEYMTRYGISNVPSYTIDNPLLSRGTETKPEPEDRPAAAPRPRKRKPRA